MKKLIALLLCSILFGCSADTEQNLNINKLQKELIEDHVFEDFQLELLKLHNNQRITKNIKKLELDQKLCNYAQSHSEKMANKDWLYHSDMAELKKATSDSNWVGENIAWGQKNENSVVNSWLWSPVHRYNILGKKYKKVGFGLSKDGDGKNYWCAVFSD